MKEKKQKPSILSQVRELNQDQKKAHKQEVEAIIKETYYADNMPNRLRKYDELKKMKWWTYLISFGLVIILTAISVGLWFGVSQAITSYVNYGITIFLIIAMMIINYNKNRKSAEHFNDKRRRYQRTFDDYEAKTFLSLKTIFLTLILFLPTVISFAVLTV